MKVNLNNWRNTMAKPKKITAPKLTSLPASPEDRKLLDSYLNEAAEYKSKIKYLSDLLASVKQSMTSPDGKLNLDANYASGLVDARYDFIKSTIKAESLSSAVADVKILDKKGE
jgi:hypothetical protein